MNIEKIDHLETMIGSLNKLLLDAKNKGIIRNKELSLLNLIFKLLKHNCYNDLNNKEQKKLLSLYYKILNKYSFLCKSNISINSSNTYIYNNIKDEFIDTNKNTAPTITNPPNLDGSVILSDPGDIYQLNSNIFINDYFDKEGDEPLNVRITTLPTYGLLTFDGELIETNFTFNISESNKLRYERISTLAFADIIFFQTSDNNINQLYSNMATFTINVNQYINLPPDEIGDNELTVANRQTIVFTQADFTTNTTPPYEDPEGDGPYKLKVKTLPLQGLLKLNGVNVTVNQEILFTQINSGLLTFVPSDTNAAFTVDFDFDISDLGSQQYSGL